MIQIIEKKESENTRRPIITIRLSCPHTKRERNTTPAKKPKHPASDAVEAMGKMAPTIVVQNQLENVVRLLALPRSRMGNISAQTTQTTGPHEYAKPTYEYKRVSDGML